MEAFSKKTVVHRWVNLERTPTFLPSMATIVKGFQESKPGLIAINFQNYEPQSPPTRAERFRLFSLPGVKFLFILNFICVLDEDFPFSEGLYK